MLLEHNVSAYSSSDLSVGGLCFVCSNDWGFRLQASQKEFRPEVHNLHNDVHVLKLIKSYLIECIYGMVAESQLPHKIVIVMFTITK